MSILNKLIKKSGTNVLIRLTEASASFLYTYLFHLIMHLFLFESLEMKHTKQNKVFLKSFSLKL